MDSDRATRPSSWIALEPPRSGPGLRSPKGQHPPAVSSGMHPVDAPLSFCESQFDIILRRQRIRPPEGGGLKLTDIPSCFLNLPNNFEFAGWGSITHLKLDLEDCNRGDELLQSIQRDKVMGQFVTGALAGNDILGGVFYTLPAVFVVSNA